MKQKPFQGKYNGGNLNKLMDNVDLIEKKDFCKLKKRQQPEQYTTNHPTVLTCNKKLSNISDDWYILQINSLFHNVFDNKPKTAFKRNENRPDLIVKKND